MESPVTAGHLIITMIAELEKQGVPSAYLRNHENLPVEVGNDVDLLVPSGKRRTVAKILANVAPQHGWRYVGSAYFSPMAIYFANPETTETLHLDLFDRLEWHFLEFAHASQVLARRQFNGRVHIPAAEDEIYLNLVTRLIYQGKIREKHQNQAREFVEHEGEDMLIRTFGEHLGKAGESIARNLAAHQWQVSPGTRKALLHAAMLNHAARRPWRAMAGVTRYGLRIIRKIVKPPGHFIVLEGADGVGKSTVLDAILPWCSEWCAGRATYDFHWKPVRLHSGPRKPTPSVDPRNSAPRTPIASLAYLGFHILGFWWGWIFRIRPLLSKSHCVVGDRYSYDLFLDPRRFRLKLPDGLCRLALWLTPKPDLTVALVADPEVVHARKPELTVDEISAYQQRWLDIAKNKPGMLTVSADGCPAEVIHRTKQAILVEIAGHAAN
jgi:thymidylate kinase